jgi:hypothetical protein
VKEAWEILSPKSPPVFHPMMESFDMVRMAFSASVVCAEAEFRVKQSRNEMKNRFVFMVANIGEDSSERNSCYYGELTA